MRRGVTLSRPLVLLGVALACLVAGVSAIFLPLPAYFVVVRPVLRYLVDIESPLAGPLAFFGGLLLYGGWIFIALLGVVALTFGLALLLGAAIRGAQLAGAELGEDL